MYDEQLLAAIESQLLLPLCMRIETDLRLHHHAAALVGVTPLNPLTTPLLDLTPLLDMDAVHLLTESVDIRQVLELSPLSCHPPPPSPLRPSQCSPFSCNSPCLCFSPLCAVTCDALDVHEIIHSSIWLITCSIIIQMTQMLLCYTHHAYIKLLHSLKSSVF